MTALTPFEDMEPAVEDHMNFRSV
uniref:Uncharacterized LOC104266751 n=1 Tax=Ciona intestinalis TaxID=7719 RepID=H2XX73_CIOIN